MSSLASPSLSAPRWRSVATTPARRVALSTYWPTMILGCDPVPNVEELQRQARAFREYHGMPLDCGCILFHLGEPFRFSGNGTRCRDVVPGVVSITHDNFVHVAAGGDPDAGAEEWVLIYAPTV